MGCSNVEQQRSAKILSDNLKIATEEHPGDLRLASMAALSGALLRSVGMPPPEVMPPEPPPKGKFTEGDARNVEEQINRTDRETNKRAWITNAFVFAGDFLVKHIFELLGIGTAGGVGLMVRSWLKNRRVSAANDELADNIDTVIGFLPVDKRSKVKQKLQASQARTGTLSTILGILNGRK